MRDCSNADGTVTSCAAADNVAGDYFEKPYYSPSLASHCSGSECSFASWGTQAHTPTPFKSAGLYYNRYRDCGDGVLEFTQLVHNFGEDEFDYLNMPWGGVRPSVLQDLLVAQPGGASALHKDYDEPMQSWGDNTYMPNIKDTGGYATFVENLVCATCGTFALPCADSSGTVVACSDATSVGQLILTKQNACAESASHRYASISVGLFCACIGLFCHMGRSLLTHTHTSRICLVISSVGVPDLF